MCAPQTAERSRSAREADRGAGRHQPGRRPRGAKLVPPGRAAAAAKLAAARTLPPNGHRPDADPGQAGDMATEPRPLLPVPATRIAGGPLDVTQAQRLLRA